MKNNLSILTDLISKCAGVALSVAVLSLTSVATNSDAAAFATPVGSWDCLTSGGGQDGITQLTFTTVTNSAGLFTLTGLTMVAGTKTVPGSSSDGNGRNPGGNPGRNGSGTGSSGSGGTVNNFFGMSPITGEWFFDSQGRLVGSYFDVVDATAILTNFQETCVNTNISYFVFSTNGAAPYPAVTNFSFCFTNGPFLDTNASWFAVSTNDGSVNFYSTNLVFANNNFTVSPIGQTNAISFVGTAVPGKRLTMVATTDFGKIRFKGVPLQPVVTANPLDGSFWQGNRVLAGESQLESFTLTATGTPNLFAMNGQGITYTYNNPASPVDQSLCLVSQQGKIAFYVVQFVSGSSTPDVRISIGNFTNTKRKISGQTRGADESDLGATLRFNATLLPGGPGGP